MQAYCLYDFDGDPNNGELSFVSGDVLDVIRQDVGEGWWEARNKAGKLGLVPETYVEIISAPEPQMPPPPVPSGSSLFPPAPSPIASTSSAFPSAPSFLDSNGDEHQQNMGFWDEDWDEDDDGGSSTSTGHSQELGGPGGGSVTSAVEPVRRERQASAGSDQSKYGSVKSTFNRFSNFAKSGGEAFLMGNVNDRVPDSDKIRIVDSADGPIWLKQDSPYTCVVSDPTKESKMKGLKSFVAYKLKSSFDNIQVSRRFKQFDWLHERLEQKYPCVPISPLPDKAVTGRYEEEFILERMRQLQAWVNRMARHPVIARSDVFHHFLTCNAKKKWKEGKRRAEKDEFQGAKFFQLLQTPNESLSRKEVDAKMETFCKFVAFMTDNMKALMTVNHDYAKKQLGPFKKEYTKIGISYKQLAQTFSLDQGAYSLSLTAAINNTGEAFIEIGEMFAAQPMKDAFPLIESFHEYKGILQTYPDVLKVHEGAVGKVRECQKQQEEGKLTQEDLKAVVARADVISYGTLAEMNHFQQERVKDFKLMMQQYLQGQITFYKQVTSRLEQALQHYNTS